MYYRNEKLQIIFGGVSRLILAKTSRWGLPAKGSNRVVQKTAYLFNLFIYLIYTISN